MMRHARYLERLTPRYGMIALIGILALVLAACPADDPEPEIDDPDAAEGEIAQQFDLAGAEFRVGSKEFTEQLILGYIAMEALEAAGATAGDFVGLGGTGENRTALEAGEIDLFWEYTGTGWLVHLGEEEPVPGAAEQYEAVAERDLEENEIRWLTPAEPNNTYAFAMNQEVAQDLGIRTISEFEQLIAERPEDATICVTEEFDVREDGLPGMQEHYGFEFPTENVHALDPPGVIYSEIDRADTCLFGTVFATDGRIAAQDLELLEDDQDFFPIYQPAVIIREDIYQEHPEVGDLFALISERLDTDTLQDLNARVDVDGEEPRDVAVEWLREAGLID
jgi:osmoprotectant transport system substrate-binding protein